MSMFKIVSHLVCDGLVIGAAISLLDDALSFAAPLAFAAAIVICTCGFLPWH
jgi:hypothetical protein